MNKQKKNTKYKFLTRLLPAYLALLVLLCGCGGGQTPSGPGESSENIPDNNGAAQQPAKQGTPGEVVGQAVTGEYPPGELHLPQESDKKETNAKAGVDFGNAGQGYIIAYFTSSKRGKVKVIKGDREYRYDINSGGEKEVFPLQMGSGTYTIKVYEHVRASEYTPVLTVSVKADIQDELLPFLYATKYTYFTQDSECVKKAYELAEGCTTDLEVVANIYDYIKNNIVYDKPKADKGLTLYTPDPDETLATQTGICWDYAALAACMLRANGIPTKLIKGTVAPNDTNHAWNRIYLQNSGWVDIDLEVEAGTWEMIDTTFAAGLGEADMAQFIGDGTNYTEIDEF